ncbi:MAG: ADOP family duplicated permease [Bryobacteraceae bacterium]
MSWLSRFVNAFRTRRIAGELDDELEFHLEQRIAEMEHRGTPRSEAELLARRKLGNKLILRESSYDVKSAVWLETLLRDVRYGLRMLAKYPAASVAAILSLALAIGACTGAFAVMDALLFRPLPVPTPNQLIDLATVMPAFFSPENQPRESDSFSYAQFELLRETAAADADLFAVSLSGGLRPAQFDDGSGASENIRAESISGPGLEILGIKPAAGRLIRPEDDLPGDGHPVAVLSRAFWKRRFGASPKAIGRWIRIGRKNFQVVGVVAGSFSGLRPGYLTDVWLPVSAALDPQSLADPDRGGISVWGRLHDRANSAALRERLQPALINFLRERVRINPPRNLNAQQRREFTDAPLHVRDASRGQDSLFRLQFRRPLLILALICGLLLLIACSNVANLMTARASAREGEMALRLSLGAGRGRLVQQLLVESAEIAVLAFAGALLFATITAPVILARLGPTEFPAWLDITPDFRTVAFTAVLSLLTAVLFGVVPALRAAAVEPNAAIQRGTAALSGRTGSLRWILTAQVGFSVTVLFLCGLLLLSFRRLVTIDLGFTSDNVVLFDLMPREPEGRPSLSGAALLEHVRRLPSVHDAALSQVRPMGGDMVWIMTPVIRLPGRANEVVRPVDVRVSAGFFRTMQIRWLAGRDFLPEEIARNSSSVIVNQAFVEAYLRGRNPIGQRFEKLTDDPEPSAQQIVGVVANARQNNPRELEGPVIYSPLPSAAGATAILRVRSSNAALIPRLRKEIELATPELTVRGSIRLRTQIDDTLIRERLLAMLAGFFSIVSLLLTGVGHYGVVNYAAIRRTREIGIRIALGARRAAVVRLMISETAMALAIGLVLGIVCGMGLTRYLVSQLFGVKPTDFWSLAAPVLSILAATALAVVPPSIRAAGADPLLALRHE